MVASARALLVTMTSVTWLSVGCISVTLLGFPFQLKNIWEQYCEIILMSYFSKFCL